MVPPVLIAHRGESRDAPENTLAAVKLAWDRGAVAVEFDVRLSADGIPMVIHDATTRRIGGPARAVNRQSAAELATIDAGAWKHPRWRGERIPQLRDVLRSAPGREQIFLEFKEGPESVDAVADVRKAARFSQKQLVVMSFHRATVEALGAAFKQAEACLLLEREHWKRDGGVEEAIEFAHAHRVDALNVEVGPDLDAEVIRRVHQAGLSLYCWTVNRVETARALFQAGMDGVTTDRCAWMRRRLEMELSLPRDASLHCQKFRET